MKEISETQEFWADIGTMSVVWGEDDVIDFLGENGFVERYEDGWGFKWMIRERGITLYASAFFTHPQFPGKRFAYGYGPVWLFTTGYPGGGCAFPGQPLDAMGDYRKRVQNAKEKDMSPAIAVNPRT